MQPKMLSMSSGNETKSYYLISKNTFGTQDQTLNMGLTCSKCLASVNGARTWLTDSIRFLAATAIASISIFHNTLRLFSFGITNTRNISIH